MVEDIVRSKVARILSGQLGLNDEDILDDASISADLGADALDFIEIRLALEEEFGLELEDDAFIKANNVLDLISLILKRIA